MYSYYDLNRVIPKRSAFCNKEKNNVQNKILRGENLYFLPTYLTEANLPETDEQNNTMFKKYEYKIILCGNLVDGRKITLIIDDIYPYFEVLLENYIFPHEKGHSDNKKYRFLPQNSNYNYNTYRAQSEYETEMKTKIVLDVDEEKYLTDILYCLENQLDADETKSFYKSTPLYFELFRAKTFKGFHENPVTFARFYYNKPKNRAFAISKLYKYQENYRMYHDDMTCYYRVACRDYLINFTNWSEISNWKKYIAQEFQTNEVYHPPTFKTDDVFRVSVRNYKRIIEITNNTQANAKNPTRNIDNLTDNTVIMSWDIETYTEGEENVPTYNELGDRIFNISLVFNRANCPEPFLKVCLVDFPANPHPNFITIVCGDEEKIIRAFAECVELVQPDIIQAFNDSEYDWPWIIYRSKQTRGLLAYIGEKFNLFRPAVRLLDRDIEDKFHSRQIKIDASTNVEMRGLQLDGYLPIDIRIIFRQYFDRAEKTSLKYFLAECGLKAKEDMPISRLFNIYGRYSRFMKHIYETDEYKNKIRESSTYESSTYAPSTHLPNTNPPNTNPPNTNPPNTYASSKYAPSTHGPSTTQYDNINNNIKADLLLNPPIPSDLQDEYKKLRAELTEINIYCVIDSQRCYELLDKKSVLLDKREISDIAFCSLADAFYLANAMKVRNMIIAYGQLQPFDLRFSNVNRDCLATDAKYSGGFVYEPDVGLKTSKLSFEERIKKCQLYDSMPSKKNAMCEWRNVSAEQLAEYRAICAKYGCNLTREEIHKIEAEENKKFDSRLVEFLTEKTGRPIAGLDFSSLYPSVMRAYNFSTEKYINNPRYAKKLYDKGIDLTYVKCQFDGREYSAYFVNHGGNYAIDKINLGARPANTDEFDPLNSFGIMPYLLDKLFNMRDFLKKEKKQLENQIEALLGQKNNFDEVEFEEKLYMLHTKFKFVNSKQLAIKVFMNTFYGTCGSKNSPFFILELANGITIYGQNSIKQAYEWVVEMGCNIYYGDTDSLYISMPEKHFKQLDIDYYTGKITKLNYWYALVEISMEVIRNVMKISNERFAEANGTNFLKMEYEEFLFAVYFIKKKKYFGNKHINVPNFDVIKLFLRGVDFIKRGVCQFVKNVGNNIFEDACKIDNLFTVRELVENTLDALYATKSIKTNEFIKSAVFRANKDNKQIRPFVDRMRAIGQEIKSGERFEYVIVKRYPYKFDAYGKQTKISVSDKMELVELVQQNKYEVDLDYYINHGIIGICVGLLSYDKEFYVKPKSTSKADIEEASKLTGRNAKKYLINYCAKYFLKYISVGPALKYSYKLANNALTASVKKIANSPIADIIAKTSSGEDLEIYLFAEINKLLGDNVRAAKKKDEPPKGIYSVVSKKCGGYGEEYVRSYLKSDLAEFLLGFHAPHIKNNVNIKKQRAARNRAIILHLAILYADGNYSSIVESRKRNLKAQIARLMAEFYALKPDINSLFVLHNKNLNDIIGELNQKIINVDWYKPVQTTEPDAQPTKNKREILKFRAEPIADVNKKSLNYIEDLKNNNAFETIKKLKKIYVKIMGLCDLYAKTISIRDYLKIQCDALHNYVEAPTDIKEQNKMEIEELSKLNLDI